MEESNNLHLFVTGGLGFIGSNFIRHILSKYPNYKITNLDKVTYCGNPENLKDVKDELFSCVHVRCIFGIFSHVCNKCENYEQILTEKQKATYNKSEGENEKI